MGLETLFDRPDSWTKVLSMIYSWFSFQKYRWLIFDTNRSFTAPKDFQEVRNWLTGRSVSETLHKKHVNTTSGQNLTPAEISFVKLNLFRSACAVIDHVKKYIRGIFWKGNSVEFVKISIQESSQSNHKSPIYPSLVPRPHQLRGIDESENENKKTKTRAKQTVTQAT